MLSIQPLAGRHDGRAFESGSAQLDAWLRQTVQQHRRYLKDLCCRHTRSAVAPNGIEPRTLLSSCKS